nr:hypothetical protein [Sedimentibacter sp.]
MKKKIVYILCTVMILINCIPFTVFATENKITSQIETNENKIASQIEITKNKIAAEIANNKFSIKEFEENNKDVGKVKSVKKEVVFDYTNDKEVLKRSLTEPVNVYCERLEIVSERPAIILPDYSDRYSILALADYTVYTTSSVENTSRTFNTYTISFSHIINFNLIEDYYAEDRDSYTTIYYAKSSSIRSSSIYNDAYVQKLDYFFGQTGFSYYVNEGYYSSKLDKTYTYSQNDGITKTLYNNDEGYVSWDYGYVSGFTSIADMYIIWKTGPWSTDGDEFTMQEHEGQGPITW